MSDDDAELDEETIAEYAEQFDISDIKYDVKVRGKHEMALVIKSENLNMMKFYLGLIGFVEMMETRMGVHEPGDGQH